MRINSLINPYHLQKLVEENYNSLEEPAQKFLLNMLVLAEKDGKISDKQALWLEGLITKMKKLNGVRAKMPRRRAPRVNHDNHEVEVRPGQGPHAARLWCVECDKHIQWITRDQDQLLTKI